MLHARVNFRKSCYTERSECNLFGEHFFLPDIMG